MAAFNGKKSEGSKKYVPRKLPGSLPPPASPARERPSHFPNQATGRASRSLARPRFHSRHIVFTVAASSSLPPHRLHLPGFGHVRIEVAVSACAPLPVPPRPLSCDTPPARDTPSSMPTPVNTQVVFVDNNDGKCVRSAVASNQIALSQATHHRLDPFAVSRPPPIYPPAPYIPTPVSPATGSAPQPTVSQPSSFPPLTQPRANTPLSPPPSTQPQGTPSTARYFAAPMDPAWLAEWEAALMLKDERIKAEQTTRENTRRIKNSCILQFYGQDGEDATRTAIQGITSFPTLCLSQRPDVLTRCDLRQDDEVEHYIVKHRFWQRQLVSETFRVKSEEVIIVRRLGVINCPRIDVHIAAASGQPVATPSLPPSHGKKRARDDEPARDDGDMSARAVIARSGIFHTSPRSTAGFSPVTGMSSNWRYVHSLPSVESPDTSPPPSSPSSRSSSHPSLSPAPLFLSPGLRDTLPEGAAHPSYAPTGSTGLGLSHVTATVPELSLPPSALSPIPFHSALCLSPSPFSPHLPLDPSDVPHDTVSPRLHWQPSPRLSLADVADSSGSDPLDKIWEAGHVFVPPEGDGLSIPWVERIYARDMAKAFALLGGKKDGLADRFRSVFPGLTLRLLPVCRLPHRVFHRPPSMPLAVTAEFVYLTFCNICHDELAVLRVSDPEKATYGRYFATVSRMIIPSLADI
ncbi:hypothetical protein VTO73DRAFT_1268 [Trametes versicolor]